MFSNFIKPRRVVITGFGCVTAIGIGRERFWESLKNGVSGVRQIESFDTADCKVKIAAEVRGFDWEAELNAKDRKHVPRTVPLALAAAREAMQDAEINAENMSLIEIIMPILGIIDDMNHHFLATKMFTNGIGGIDQRHQFN